MDTTIRHRLGTRQKEQTMTFNDLGTPERLMLAAIALAIGGYLYWVHYDATHYDRILQYEVQCLTQWNGDPICIDTNRVIERRVPKSH